MRLFSKFFLPLICLLTIKAKAQFTVLATVQHVDPTGGTSGNIILNASGGTSFTYSWSPGGSTSSSITSVSSGSYACSVKDGGGTTQSYTYNLGYKARWNTFSGVTFRNDSLILSSPHLDWNTAISRNTLLGGNDGWAEIVLQSTSNLYMLGFVDSISPIPGIFSDIDFGFYVSNANLYSVINGNLTYLNSLNAGDVLHIERTSGVFYLKQNGSITYSTTMSSSTDYKLKAGLDLDPVVNVGTSFADSTSLQFPEYLQDIPLVRHATPGLNNGTLTLMPKEANGVHTYSWTNVSSTSSVVSSLTPNIVYTVEVTDNASNHNKQKFNVGYKTYWKDLYGATFRNDSLIYNPVSFSSSQMGNAVSKNTLPSNVNGWAEIVMDNRDLKFTLGFSDSIVPISDDNNDIDAGFLAYNSSLYSFRNGTTGWLGYSVPGDILRIERKDSLFILKQNSVTLYTLVISKSANYKLKASGYFGPTTSPLVNIGASFKDSTNFSFPGFAQVIPYIKHSSGVLISNGSISLTPRYSETGNTYTWTTISQYSNSINNLLQNSYPVTIADVNGNKSNYVYDDMYKTDWTRLEGNIFRNDSIISTSPYTSTGWCTALSQNIIKAGTDGEISWVNTADGKDVFIGLLDVPSSSVGVYTDIDFGILKTYGNILYRYMNGSFDTPGFSAAHGDVIKIKRTGSLLEYFINNTPIFSNTVSTASDWNIKMAQYIGTSIADIGWSYPSSLNMSITATHTNASTSSSTDGAITLSVTGGDSPYTYEWSGSTATTNAVSSLSAGVYNATVTDSYYRRAGITVTINTCSLTANAGSSPIYFNIGDSYTLTGSGSGGTTPYSYSWTPNSYVTPTVNGNLSSTMVVSPPGPITYSLTIKDAYSCVAGNTVNLIPFPYALLRSVPDGGYYKLNQNKMLFKYDGQYAATTLTCNVYNSSNAVVITTGLAVNSGDSRYALNAASLSTGYYMLEMINEKKEKLYLRFYKP